MMIRYCRIFLFQLGLLLFLITASAAYLAPAESACYSGFALVERGNYSGAVTAFETAIAAEPGYFEAWNGKADALNRDGYYAEALLASDQALAISPVFAQGWINRGYILYNLGRYDEELAAYDRAISLSPDSADAWFNRGYALAGMGKYDEALQSFDKVAQINPSYPNLAANRRIAEQNRDAANPYYFRYALWIVVGMLITAYAALILYNALKKRQ